jgi:hypothetical protein
LTVAVTVSLGLLLGSATNAALVYEADVAQLGDAGDLPSTATVLNGQGAIDTIFGHMHDDQRWTDMFGVHLRSEADAGFTPSVVPAGNNGDFGTLNIFLFDSTGRGIIGGKYNYGIFYHVPAGAGGLYFIAITPADGDPYGLTDPTFNFHAKIFANNLGNAVFPGGPAATLPVDSWGGVFGATPDAYRIDMRNVEFVAPLGNGGGSVSEPGTLALLGLGLAGLAATRRRKQ